MNCGALILAAGASTRFGSAKQLVIFEGETLLARAVRIAQAAGCKPVVVVLGARENLIRNECDLSGVLVVSNPDWAEGMGTSLTQGIRALEGCPGVVVMTCDMPAVTANHLRALASSGAITASSYADRKGVPAYFPEEVFPALLSTEGDAGARDLLRSAAGIDLAGGELDIDTPEDLARCK
jgi:molybdenum cofactor cytidylyltransferase